MKRSKQSVVPQWKPEGQLMTTLEQDEKGFYKSEGSLELRLDHFAEFVRDGKRRYSAPVCVRGLAWRIYAYSTDSDSGKGSDSDTSQSNDDSGQLPSKNLAVYMYFLADSTCETWKCEATFPLRVIAQNDGARDIIRRNLNSIFVHNNGRGLPHFANCDVLLDPEKSYIKDDAIVLQAHIRALNVKAMPGIHVIESGPLFSSSTKYPWDFVLVIQDNEVHVQKSILSLHSEFFKNQFGKHKCNKRAIMEDVNYDEFIVLLSIIYRTGCSITEENVETISKLALKFEMAGLLKECEVFLVKYTTNVGRAKALSMAESCGLVYLQVVSFNLRGFVQGQVIDEVKNIADIKNMKPELDTLSHRTKRMLLDRIGSSGPAFNPISASRNIGISTSRATEILEKLTSSACTATDGFLVVEKNRIPIHKGSEYAKKYRKMSEVEKLRTEPEYVLFDDQTRALILDSLTS